MAASSHVHVRFPPGERGGVAGGSTANPRRTTRMTGVRRALRVVAIWASIVNLVMIVAVTVLLRTVGESWWLTALLAYSPRLLLAGPLLLTVPLLAWCGPRPLLWTQVVAFFIWLFPLMGFQWALQVPAAHGPPLRLLTYNVARLRGGADGVCKTILAQDADVVVLQEAAGPRTSRLVTCLSASFPEVHSRGEFLLASRFPVRKATPVQGFSYRGEPWQARAARYELETPLGSLALYSIHPGSPREAVAAMRQSGLREQLRRHNIFGGYAAKRARSNVAVRELQFAAALRQAAAEPGLVIVAGDTNLPGLSPVIATHTRRFQDGFEQAGQGFGYSYPSRAPFVRIDRIFADRRLAFNSFGEACGQASDHQCLVADVSLRPESERRAWLRQESTSQPAE